LGDKVLALRNSDQGERKYVTILVADILDYSSISGKLSPEEAYKVMAHCLTMLGDQISHYGGITAQVTKGIVKGLFGVPVAYEDHAKRACDAALSILESIGAYEQKLRKKTDVKLQMRIGLVSGLILTGSVSSGADLDYKDLEDVDDLIPMVQSITLTGKVVVTRSTYVLARDFFEFRPIRECGIPGQKRTVESYVLLKPRGFVSSIHAKQVKGLSKFVGREHEMSVLLEAAGAAREGCGQVVAVTGDAGVGKSRLVFELKRRLPEGQQTFLEGYCRSYDGVPPYHPFLDMLKSLFGIQTGEHEGAVQKKIQERLSCLVSDYGEIIAPLHQVLALKVHDDRYLGLPFQEKRNRIFQAIERILVGASEKQLLVVIVEDLHWIDRTSEEVLNYLMGRINKAKILFVIMYRPEYQGALSEGTALREIHLSELSGEYVKELVESILGGHEVDEPIIRLIFDKTGGNPLFLEELTRALSDGGAIQRADGKFLLAQDAGAELLPRTIQAVIAARMDRLEKDVKTTLQIASVIGREVPVALLERISEIGVELESHILRLQDLEFMHETWDSAQRQFEFKHALTQEAVYNSLLMKQKKKLHQKIGAVIEQLFSERLEDFCEQLAYHFSRSGDLKKEFHYLKLSAIKASRQNSPWEAYRFCKEALGSLKEQPANEENQREEIEVLTVLHWVIIMLGYGPEDSEQILKRGEELSLELNDEKSLSFFRADLCIYYFGIGDGISRQEYVHHLLRDVRAMGNAVLTKDQLRLIVPLALYQAASGLTGANMSEVLPFNLRILKSMEDAQAVFESYDMPFNAYSFICAISASLLAMIGDFDGAMILCAKALKVALEAQNLHSAGYAEMSFGFVLCHRGQGKQAMDHFRKSIDYWERANVGPAFLMSAWSGLGYAHFLAGDPNGASKFLSKGIQMQLDSRIRFFLSLSYLWLSEAYLASGDLKNARSCVDSALEWSEKCGETHWQGWAKIQAGRILAEGRLLQAARAEASILEGIEIVTELGMRPYCAQGYLHLGELCMGTGRIQLSIKNLKKAERMFKKMGMEYWLRKTQEVLSRFQTTT
jgi:class 3 adenylate cyclase/tetratricopeptide (TPR) repeat protein/adenylate kinase